MTGVLLLSGVGVGAAYGITAPAARAPARDLVLAHASAEVHTVPVRAVAMRTLPVTAPFVVAESDLDDRVSGPVNEAGRIVAEKFEAQQKAAEEAARAAKGAQQKAAADPPACGVKQEGDCSGTHGGK